MTAPVAASLYGVGVGSASTGNLIPFVTTGAPASTNIKGPYGPFIVGQQWIDQTGNASYQLTSFSSLGGSVTANWIAYATLNPTFTTLTVTGLSTLGPVTQVGALSMNATGSAASTIGNVSTGGAIEVASSTTLNLDAGGNIAINSSGSFIGVGNSAGTSAVNLGTGAGIRTITLGNSTSGTAITGLGTFSMNTTGAAASTIGNVSTGGAIEIASSTTLGLDAGGNIAINSSGSSIGLGNNANTSAINIGTGAAARVITMGNATGATSVTLTTGTGGISLNDANGKVAVTPATISTGSATFTLNARVGVATVTGASIVGSASLTINITNSFAVSGAGLIMTLSTNTSSGNTRMSITGIRSSGGVINMVVTNSGSDTFTDNLTFSFWILN